MKPKREKSKANRNQRDKKAKEVWVSRTMKKDGTTRKKK